MKPQIIRPQQLLSEDKREEIRRYLHLHWLRARDGRATQIDSKYNDWTKVYHGIPAEETRTVPFYKASNFVVKLVRMFLDTFVARTLNIIYATRPTFVTDDLPQQLKEGWEYYLNRKVEYAWNYYDLTKSLAFSGNKNGTAVIKTIYDERDTIDVMPSSASPGGYSETATTYWSGPCSELIPFEDFFVYPITAPSLDKVEIKMHRQRFTEDEALYQFQLGTWQLTTNPDDEQPEKTSDISKYLTQPTDTKGISERTSAGVDDTGYREMQAIECHFRYSITNDRTKRYDCVALIHPDSGDLLDLYYNPYPQNLGIFTDYRPFPREGLFYGESMCEILGQAQEETSRIHNERRDNSTISSSVCFKRRSGSLIPNPSTSWYPGKVWDLESLDDLEVFDIGRSYQDMIEQEQVAVQYAEKLSGIGEVMQGASSGTIGKRGVYNTMGTIALMQESNTRQDTNIRDVRTVLSRIVQTASKLQATYGADDPFIDALPQAYQENVREVLQLFKGNTWRYINHSVKASDAGVNKEVRRNNLVQMAQVLGQYGQTIIQMSTQLANPGLNPVIKQTMIQVVEMSRWMAERLSREFEEPDVTDLLPDLAATLGAGGAANANPGGPAGTLPAVPPQLLAQLSQMPQAPGAAATPNGVPQTPVA